MQNVYAHRFFTGRADMAHRRSLFQDASSTNPNTSILDVRLLAPLLAIHTAAQYLRKAYTKAETVLPIKPEAFNNCHAPFLALLTKAKGLVENIKCIHLANAIPPASGALPEDHAKSDKDIVHDSVDITAHVVENYDENYAKKRPADDDALPDSRKPVLDQCFH